MYIEFRVQDLHNPHTPNCPATDPRGQGGRPSKLLDRHHWPEIKAEGL